MEGAGEAASFCARKALTRGRALVEWWRMIKVELDPKRDLVLERVVDVAPERLWRGWTEPELLKQWFCPKPWKTVEAEMDLRPGGKFRTVMEGPNGERFDEGAGCFLEVVPNRRLSWTSGLGPGFRPNKPAGGGCADLVMTAIITFEPHGAGTKYRAEVLHFDEESAKKHAEMGFEQGWGIALDQLVEVAKKL